MPPWCLFRLIVGCTVETAKDTVLLDLSARKKIQFLKTTRRLEEAMGSDLYFFVVLRCFLPMRSATMRTSLLTTTYVLICLIDCEA